jgi:CubicO group peptidase (beta-lactamase class C family)
MWCSGYGTTGTGRRDHVSPRTVFQARSIGKHATAFGAPCLVAGSVLALDSDIGSYLATWQPPADGG